MSTKPDANDLPDPNAEPETTGTSDYLRYFKNAETTFRVLQEPDEWVDYWEHFNPNGYPFPCTRDRKIGNCGAPHRAARPCRRTSAVPTMFDRMFEY